MVVIKDSGGGGIVEKLFKGINLQVGDKFWRFNAQYSDYRHNTALYKSNLLRDQVLIILFTKEVMVM